MSSHTHNAERVCLRLLLQETQGKFYCDGLAWATLSQLPRPGECWVLDWFRLGHKLSLCSERVRAGAASPQLQNSSWESVRLGVWPGSRSSVLYDSLP
jgi:hypothetical protein